MSWIKTTANRTTSFLEDKLTRFDKYMWKRQNRKPPRSWEIYLGAIGGWLFVGLMAGLVFLAINGMITQAAPTLRNVVIITLMSAVLLAWLASMVYIVLNSQKQSGMFKAITEEGFRQWREKATKLGMTAEVEAADAKRREQAKDKVTA